jgi:hypothetical protein
MSKDTCQQICIPKDNFKIFTYYQNWGQCFTSYNMSDAGEPKKDVFQQVLSLGATEIAFAFCLLSKAHVGGSKTPISPYILYSGVNGYNLASFKDEQVLSNDPSFKSLKSSFVTPVKNKGLIPFIGFGGWSDNTDFALEGGVSSWESVGNTIAYLCNALQCGLVLDFEHLSQSGFSSFEKQAPNFISMIKGIKNKLKTDLPFHFCTRFNGCYSSDTDKDTPPTKPLGQYPSDNEFKKILNQLGKSCKDWFSGVQIMAYDDQSRMNYENIILYLFNYFNEVFFKEFNLFEEKSNNLKTKLPVNSI